MKYWADDLKFEVVIQDLPKNITVGNVKIGAAVNLTVQMEVYPPPRKEHYSWWIEKKSGKDGHKEAEKTNVRLGK